MRTGTLASCLALLGMMCESSATSFPARQSLPLYSSLDMTSRRSSKILPRQEEGEEEEEPPAADNDVEDEDGSRGAIPAPVSVPLRDASYSHFLPLAIGTPPQPLLVLVDTGSWEFWVNPVCDAAPPVQQAACLANGQYDPDESSTAELLKDEEGALLEYSPGGQSYATVNFVSDVLTIGGGDVGNGSDNVMTGGAGGEVEEESAVDIITPSPSVLKLESFRIGVANDSAGLGNSILGLGPHPDPGIGFMDRDNITIYGGVLGGLQKAGLIGNRAYGMDLVSRGGGGSGAIVFGGLDINRYTGPLFRLNVTPPSDAPTETARFWARVTTIYGGLEGAEPEALYTPYQDYLLDSGTTYSFLPTEVYGALAEALNATLDSELGLMLVDCALLDDGESTGAAVFQFGDTAGGGGEGGAGNITVPYENFVIDARTVYGRPVGSGGGLGCVFGVSELKGVVGTDVMPVLGVGFMKSAYTVFDLDNADIHMAQAASCGDPDIVAIESGIDAVPMVEGNC